MNEASSNHKFIPGPIEWGMNWPSVLLIMIMLLMNRHCSKWDVIWLGIMNESASNHKFIPRSNWVRDELTFSTSDNNDAPESPMLLLMECNMITNNEWNTIKSQVPYKSNWVRDELTFSTDDNNDAPDEPILLQMECDMIINNEWNIIKSQIHSQVQLSEGWIDLQCFW